ncbi:hypothetical protein [Thermococcus sp. 5-4]|uniref:hypothetical protein n=1 Tax=Thermococcus sp. 5-4 TaxID=2008440 RepID=UPI000B4A3888|nr:hypothetical protein [Thermococcus sp. 5-4]ASA77509.1 hypothetical protein CDI07_04095 [Thermococcus sp. 5-4]
METGGDGPGIGASIVGILAFLAIMIIVVLVILGILVFSAALLVVIVPLTIIMAVVGWIKGKRRKEPKELEEPWQYEEWEGRW